jgi:hypothetical protein
MNCRKETKPGRKANPRVLSVIILTCILFIVGQSVCFASSVTLQWEPVDSELVVGYKIYYQADSSAQPYQGTGADQGASPIDVHTNTTATISGLNPNRAYYFAVTAYNASGESAYSNIAAINVLSVTLSGTGNGNVNSSPSGISCLNGTCVSQFNNGESLTLLASSRESTTSLSYFSGWLGGCTSTNGSSCTVDLTASKAVTATFSSLQPVHIDGGNFYSSIQSAYGAASNNGNIEAQAVTLTGSFTASSTNTITLKGGYNAKYSGRSGYTVMAGTLSVAKGTLVVDNLVIK